MFIKAFYSIKAISNCLYVYSICDSQTHIQFRAPEYFVQIVIICENIDWYFNHKCTLISFVFVFFRKIQVKRKEKQRILIYCYCHSHIWVKNINNLEKKIKFSYLIISFTSQEKWRNLKWKISAYLNVLLPICRQHKWGMRWKSVLCTQSTIITHFISRHNKKWWRIPKGRESLKM